MAKPPIMKAAELEAEKKARLYALLAQLHDESDKMAKAKVKVDEAKEALVKEYFPKLDEGTSNVLLEFGKKLVLKQPIYRKVDEALLQVAITERTIPTSDVNNVIKYTPEVKVGEWKALPTETQKLFGDIITETRGAVNFAIENVKS